MDLEGQFENAKSRGGILHGDHRRDYCNPVFHAPGGCSRLELKTEN
jgi:hypothetical protein